MSTPPFLSAWTALAQTTLPATQPTTQAAGSVATGATGPVPTVPMALGSLAVLGVFALAVTFIGWFLGAFRRGVEGPVRLPRNRPVWPTLLSLGGAIMTLIVVLSLLVAVTDLVPEMASDVAAPETGVETVIQEPEETGPAPQPLLLEENPVLAMQVQVAAYGAAVLAGLLLHGLARARGVGATLGLGVERLGPGVLFGMLALLIVIPWMLAAAAGLQAVRLLLGYSPEAMHQVLQAIRDNPELRTILWGLVSALVIAPVAEEILFRGLLQTALVHGLPRLFGGGASAEGPRAGFPVIIGADSSAVASRGAEEEESERPFAPPPAMMPSATPAVATHEVREAGSPRPVWRWTGIVVTALLFASLHEPWSFPLIFLLAVAFGYIYERTGNLWASMTVHLGFNAINILFVLLQLTA